MRKVAYLIILSGLVAGCRSQAPPAPVAGQTAYTQPLVSPGAQFSEAPPAVQRTIRAEAGGAPIGRIREYKLRGKTIYRILFKNPGVYPPLLIAADGSVLNSNLTVAVGGVGPGELTGVLTSGPVNRVPLGELPPKAVRAIQQSAPDAEIDVITRESHGNEVIYVVTFRNNRHAPLYLDETGKILPSRPSWVER